MPAFDLKTRTIGFFGKEQGVTLTEVDLVAKGEPLELLLWALVWQVADGNDRAARATASMQDATDPEKMIARLQDAMRQASSGSG